MIGAGAIGLTRLGRSAALAATESDANAQPSKILEMVMKIKSYA
jgi:hypothetical protein